MPHIKDLSIVQLQRAIAIKQQIETLQSQLDSIEGGTASGVPSSLAPTIRKKRRMSRAGRAAIAAGARARWAKIKGTAVRVSEKPVAKKRKKFSAATRAKMAANARARWKKAKAAGKATL
jgi:hypothetical protein